MDRQEFFASLAQRYESDPEGLLNLLLEMFPSVRLGDSKRYYAIGGIGYELSRLGYSKLGLFLNEKALEWFTDARDINGQGHCHIGISVLYYQSGEFQRAVEHSEKALNIFIATKSVSDQLGCYINLASSYNELGEYEKAIQYSKEVLSRIDYSKNEEDKKQNLMKAYGNSANSYRGLAGC